MDKDIIKKKIDKVIELIKIIRDDLLIIDFDGIVYKISKSDYFILKLIIDIKDYNKIKEFLKNKFKSEEELNIFINAFLDKYINTISISKYKNEKLNINDEIDFFEKNKVLKAPLVVSLQLLETCNLNCKHCYTKAGNDKNKSIDFEKVKLIMEQLHSLKVFRLGLTGGETLLYKELNEVIKIATKYKIITTITTNGMLLAEETANELKNSGLNHIHISIDGGRDIHNNIRGNIYSYDNAINAIEICKKIGLPVEINYTIMKSNINCFNNMLDLAKKYDIQINIRRVIPTGRGRNDLEEILDYNDYDNILKQIVKSDYNKIKLDYCFFNKNQYRGNCKTNNKCILTINSKGNVYTCPYLQYDEFIVGNINEEKLEDIYEKIQDTKLVNFNKNNLKNPCNECEIFEQCYGGCRANAYILYNDLYDLDIQCEKCYKVKNEM